MQHPNIFQRNKSLPEEAYVGYDVEGKALRPRPTANRLCRLFSSCPGQRIYYPGEGLDARAMFETDPAIGKGQVEDIALVTKCTHPERRVFRETGKGLFGVLRIALSIVFRSSPSLPYRTEE
jgi:hypothetical protein